MNYPDIMTPTESLPYLTNMVFPPYITLAHIFHAEKNWYIHRREILQYQIQYVIEGIAQYEIEGQTYTTQKGDLLLHYPHEIHSVTTIPSQPYVCISLVFHFGDMDFRLKELVRGTNYMGRFLDDPLSQQLTQIPSLFRDTHISSRLVAQGLLTLILAKLIRLATEPLSPSPKELKTKANLIQVEHYIQQHFDRDITHNELQQISGYSRNHLIMQYKERYQVTPFEHIRLLRVRKAKQLALDTNLSVSKIAEVVGYRNVHAFSKMFKKMTGISLSQYCAALVINKP